MAKPKQIFYYKYDSNCYMEVTQNMKKITVVLKGSYFCYKATYSSAIANNKDILQDIKAYCKKHTGYNNKRRKLSENFAHEILEALESKQLTLFKHEASNQPTSKMHTP